MLELKAQQPLCVRVMPLLTVGEDLHSNGWQPALDAAARSWPVSSTAFMCRKPKSQRPAASASATVAACDASCLHAGQ